MRVTVLPYVFLCVFTIGFLLDDESSLRRVLERWCRLLRCRCLLWCRRLLFEHSESAGSVVVRDSSFFVGMVRFYKCPCAIVGPCDVEPVLL